MAFRRQTSPVCVGNCTVVISFVGQTWKLIGNLSGGRICCSTAMHSARPIPSHSLHMIITIIGITHSASYSALNGIAVSFEAYFSFFRLAEYRVFRLELTNFLQKDCYQKYLKKKCPGAQYLNRNSKILIFLLAHRMYFLSWLLFGVGRKIKRTLDTVSKSWTNEKKAQYYPIYKCSWA